MKEKILYLINEMISMRDLQKSYFSTRKKGFLIRSKEKEKELDLLLPKILAEVKDLQQQSKPTISPIPFSNAVSKLLRLEKSYKEHPDNQTLNWILEQTKVVNTMIQDFTNPKLFS